MRLNGLSILVEMGVRAADDPLVRRYRHAVLLGSMREDVAYVPIAGLVYEHFSLHHFHRAGLPGGLLPFVSRSARGMADRTFARAVELKRAGRIAGGFVQLGRVAHLLADMACPWMLLWIASSIVSGDRRRRMGVGSITTRPTSLRRR